MFAHVPLPKNQTHPSLLNQLQHLQKAAHPHCHHLKGKIFIINLVMASVIYQNAVRLENG
jgi:hypothetical protein